MRGVQEVMSKFRDVEKPVQLPGAVHSLSTLAPEYKLSDVLFKCHMQLYDDGLRVLLK